MKNRGLLVLNSALVLASLLGLWQLVIWLNHLPPYILPGPLAVATAVRYRYPSLLQSLQITAGSGCRIVG